MFSGLPLSVTKEDLEKLFGQYGTLKDVRLVTYRNGHSKGMAYVDFEDEVSSWNINAFVSNLAFKFKNFL